MIYHNEKENYSPMNLSLQNYSPLCGILCQCYFKFSVLRMAKWEYSWQLETLIDQNRESEIVILLLKLRSS